MIWFWTAAGVVIGRLSARRDSWGALALTLSVLGLLTLAVARRFETDTLFSVAAFWIAAQSAWFVSHLLSDRRAGSGAEDARRALD